MRKEKYTEEIRIVVPPSLYSPFVEKCEKDHKTMSQALRELMWESIEEGEEDV
jgi:hypothetical protein